MLPSSCFLKGPPFPWTFPFPSWFISSSLSLCSMFYLATWLRFFPFFFAGYFFALLLLFKFSLEHLLISQLYCHDVHLVLEVLIYLLMSCCKFERSVMSRYTWSCTSTAGLASLVKHVRLLLMRQPFFYGAIDLIEISTYSRSHRHRLTACSQLSNLKLNG